MNHSLVPLPRDNPKTSAHRQRSLLPVRTLASSRRRHRYRSKKTRPRRPQTNGKVERFHGILVEEWPYIRHWNSEAERHHGYTGFIHFYNNHRPYGSLGWATPRQHHRRQPPRGAQLVDAQRENL